MSFLNYFYHLTWIILASTCVIALVRFSVWAKNLGEVILAYSVGIFVRNFVPFTWSSEFLSQLSSIVIPVALFIMLAQSSPKALWQGGPRLIVAWVGQVLSVLIAAFVIKAIFVHSSSKLLSALSVAVYTGGVINLAMLANTLATPPEVFGRINMADIAAGTLYLMVMMGLGRFILTHSSKNETLCYTVSKFGRRKKPSFMEWILPVGSGLLVLIFSYFISQILGLGDDPRLILILLTIAGLVFSFWPIIRNNSVAQIESDVLVVIFSVCMGLMADFRDFTIAIIPDSLFLISVMSVSITLHFLWCRLWKLPSGLFVATSAGGIMSPPFVPSICKSAKHPEWISFGVASGLAGNSIGTLLGLTFYTWLT